jgi:hypothetical protein
MATTRRELSAGQYDPNYMLGWLSAVLDDKGRVTTTDWNQAYESAVKNQRRKEEGQ